MDILSEVFTPVVALCSDPVSYVAITAVSAVIGLPPSSMVNGIAGSIYGLYPGTALFVGASVLGAVASLLMVRYLLKDFVEKKIVRKYGYTGQWKALNTALAKEGPFFIVMLLRLSPIMPFFIANLVLGLTTVEVLPYTAGTPVGLLPFSIVYVYLGELGFDLVHNDVGDNMTMYLNIAGLLVTLALTYKITVTAQTALDEATGTGKPKRKMSGNAGGKRSTGGKKSTGTSALGDAMSRLSTSSFVSAIGLKNRLSELGTKMRKSVASARGSLAGGATPSKSPMKSPMKRASPAPAASAMKKSSSKAPSRSKTPAMKQSTSMKKK